MLLAIGGCSSNDTSHDEKALGPMPTSPPPGSPYAKTAAPTSNTTSMSRSQFLSKLQQLSPADRPAFVQSNPNVVSEIMTGTDESAKKMISAAMVVPR